MTVPYFEATRDGSARRPVFSLGQQKEREISVLSRCVRRAIRAATAAFAIASVGCVPTATIVEDAADSGADGGADSGADGGGGGGGSAPPWQYAVVAGNGTSGFSGDQGPAAKAQLGGYLSGIATDAAGNVYIADAGNARIRKVDTSGVISTYGGTGASGKSGDGGPAIQAKLYGPTGIAVDAAGNVYFSEYKNDDIRRIDDKGVITTYVTLPGRPTGLSIDPAGNLYVAMFEQHEILAINTGKQVTIAAGKGSLGYSGDGGPAIAAALNGPDGVWIDDHGVLFIDDEGNHVIRKVDNEGTITTFAGKGAVGYSGDEGPATAAKLDSAYGIVSDGLGNVYFCQGADNVIRHVDPSGVIHTIAGNGSIVFASKPGPALGLGIVGPQFLWLGAQGDLYFSDIGSVVGKLSR